MKIGIINPPYRAFTGTDAWITVPPQGYGAIQWVCAHLISGLLALGHEIELLGAPGSREQPGLRVLDAVSAQDFDDWACGTDADVVHDHTNGLIDPSVVQRRAAFVSTHHLTGRPRYTQNCVYVSAAQRASGDGPVIPLPIDPRFYRFEPVKQEYLLFLGRISPHKGAYEAASFAAAARRPLVLAGPSWEPEYLRRILASHPGTVSVVGEVGGSSRIDWIAGAAAVLVLSQPVMGPWGHDWCEPGATVVSEAAVSGTPVIATRNGCLPVVASDVGVFVHDGSAFSPAEAQDALAALPPADHVRAVALERWDHLAIARRYESVYRRVAAGDTWG